MTNVCDETDRAMAATWRALPRSPGQEELVERVWRPMPSINESATTRETRILMRGSE